MRYEHPIHYNKNSEKAFQNDLRQQVNSYFATNGLPQTATPFMWVKVFVFVSQYWLFWSLLAFHAWSIPVTILLFVGLAATTIFVAFNVSHDAVHDALSGRRWLDHLIFYFTFNFLGPNAYLWRIRHVNAHHFFVNVPGSDMDIEGTSLLRVAPHIRWRPWHRFQHLYCGLFYSLFTLHWVFVKDFKIIRMKSFGSMTDLKHPWWRFAEMVLWKIVYVGYMILIPMAFLPHSTLAIVLGFIAFHLLTSFSLLVLFAMSHIALESHYVIRGEEGHVDHSFLEHQLLTSVDYNSQNPVMGFFLGGFNNHVAHHMFPAICSVHYIPLTRLIKESAARHGLPYHDRTFWSLARSHFALMKELGSSPESGERYVVQPEGRKVSSTAQRFPVSLPTQTNAHM